MKFQLPQFIQTESKLVGPFTLKQFIWVAAGSAIVMLEFVVFNGLWFFLIGIPTAVVFIAFAFIKIDGMPLANFFTYMLSYGINPKRYTYRKDEEPVYQNIPAGSSDINSKS